MRELLDRSPLGTALKRLIAGIDLDFECPTTDVPQSIRQRLQAELQSPDLYFSCAERLLRQVLVDPDSRVLYADPQSRYTLQLFVWPPGFGNRPHLHNNWTVSAVFTNSLLVFRSTISEADCLSSQPLLATAGSAGILIPPQFHCLRNATEAPSVTFHVFSSGPTPDQGLSHTERPSGQSRINNSGLLAIARAVSRYADPRRIDIIRAAFAVAGESTKLELVKLMAQVDISEAVALGHQLAEEVGGVDGARLLHVIRGLSH